MPTQMFGVRVKPLFAGLALRNLGKEALFTAEAALLSEAGIPPSPVKFNLTFVTSDGNGVISQELAGWTSRMYSGGEGREQADGLLLWGLIDSV